MLTVITGNVSSEGRKMKIRQQKKVQVKFRTGAGLHRKTNKAIRKKEKQQYIKVMLV